MAKLTKWIIGQVPAEVAIFGPLAPMRLGGFVQDHAKLKDGEHIMTSPIVAIEEGGVCVTHSGTRYTLEGEPDENFKAFFIQNADKIDPENKLAALVRCKIHELCN